MNAPLTATPPPLPPSAAHHPKPVPLRAVPSSAQAASARPRLLKILRGLLQDSFRLRYEGAAYAALAHAQGYADGFMRALVDGGVLSQQELLEFIQDARRGQAGPATTSLGSE